MPATRETKRRLIYRLVHRENVPWLLQHGVVSRSYPRQDPHYRNIGNLELIDRRAKRQVPIPPGGVLNDYVPFYFCTHSAMLYNIHTNKVEGVSCPQSEVVYLVTSIERLVELRLRFTFTDRHAFVQNACFFSDPENLAKLDWPLLKSRDFRRDPDDPGKLERRQAECLVHEMLPVSALLGIACENDETTVWCAKAVRANGLELPVLTRVEWFF